MTERERQCFKIISLFYFTYVVLVNKNSGLVIYCNCKSVLLEARSNFYLYSLVLCAVL